MNRLAFETSSYLLQHKSNPVDWYPWGDEAFEKARREDKPVFLSVGYSTCHWCHVMERESFEKDEVAQVLNKYFVSIKVDREQRPDIDNIYMRFCQMMTNSGGWPMSIFMTPDGRPFYAGTYFPKEQFIKLLLILNENWCQNKEHILGSVEQIVEALAADDALMASDEAPIEEAVNMFEKSMDREFGGFGKAPKFPTPHNLMFLLYAKPELAEKTLLQMYKGGIFDHIGYGFCRYSTDRFWMAPHFEKMLYDNALLASTYLFAFEKTGKQLYADISEKVFRYIKCEMTSVDGTFYSAQDADSDGVEGKYYLFKPKEIIDVLGETEGQRFCAQYNITENGNFKGQNIPNLIAKNDIPHVDTSKLYAYRKTRNKLHLDTKILTSWNALMISAYANGYRILKKKDYLTEALKAFDFICNNQYKGGVLYSETKPGFLDDYAFMIYASLCLHQATLKDIYLDLAKELTQTTVNDFFDAKKGGFYFSGKHNEKLIINPKECYDGAIPSGNSFMAYNLSRLEHEQSHLQNQFMNAQAKKWPMGLGFYLFSALPYKKIICTPRDEDDIRDIKIKTDWFFMLGDGKDYPLVDDKTTYYICDGKSCRLPVNSLSQEI